MSTRERRVPIEEARKKPGWWRWLNRLRDVDFARRDRRLERRSLERENQALRRSIRLSRQERPVIQKARFYERTAGKIHEHQISEIKKNHQGKEFVRCLTCGAFSFGD